MMKLQKLKYLPTWLPALLMMLIIFGFSSLPSDGIPDFNWANLLIKKGGHLLGYAILATAYLYAFGLDIKKWKLVWILAILYACTDEFHQSFVPGRGSTVIDVGIDTIGAGLALLWAYKTSAFSLQTPEK